MIKEDKITCEDITEEIPWECGNRDCPVQWHKATYWINITESGKTSYTVDNYSDGDHEECESVPTPEEVEKAWKKYGDYCLDTGTDVLEQYFLSKTYEKVANWQARFRLSIAGVICSGMRKNGRGKWLKPDEASKEARNYLCIKKMNNLWKFKEVKGTTSENFRHLWELAKKDEDVQLQRSKSYEIKFVFQVKEKHQLSESTYKRKLRKLIKK